MFRNILDTTIVKILNALVTFAVLLINARMLGPENLGTIGLILLAVTIILMLNNLVGGGALVFLIPRFSLKRIVSLSYGWTVIASVIGTALYGLLKIEPVDYLVHIFFLSLVLGFCFVNQNALLGVKQIRLFNLITLIQYVILIVAVVVIFYGLKRPGIGNYLLAMYLSWGAQLVLSTVAVIRLAKQHTVNETNGLIKSILKYGFFVQIANLTQFFNYRLTYYFVEAHLGRSKLGVFEIGNKLADGVWLFAKSISMVQYSFIANASAEDDTVKLTLRLFKFSFLISLILVLCMVALPQQFYLFLFGDQYTGLYTMLLFLAPGIVFMSSSMILAHYFAGIGKHYINTIGSVIGLVSVTLLCVFLVPGFGLNGAATAASLSYLISLLYNLIVFGRFTRTQLKEYLFSAGDLKFIRDMLSGLLKKIRTPKVS
jgi:O-antigen/teichoic acid export membrane protein